MVIELCADNFHRRRQESECVVCHARVVCKQILERAESRQKRPLPDRVVRNVNRRDVLNRLLEIEIFYILKLEVQVILIKVYFKCLRGIRNGCNRNKNYIYNSTLL